MAKEVIEGELTPIPKPVKPKPDTDKSFAEHLTALREDAGITVSEASAGSGISEDLWTQMETDGMHPKVRMLRPMARVLGVWPYEVL